MSAVTRAIAEQDAEIERLKAQLSGDASFVARMIEDLHVRLESMADRASVHLVNLRKSEEALAALRARFAEALTKHTARKLKMKARYEELAAENNRLKSEAFGGRIARRVAKAAVESAKAARAERDAAWRVNIAQGGPL